MLTPVSSTGQALPDAIISLLNQFAPMFQAIVESAGAPRRRGSGHAQAHRHLRFASATFCMSSQKPDIQEVPTPVINRFIESLTYAA